MRLRILVRSLLLGLSLLCRSGWAQQASLPSPAQQARIAYYQQLIRPVLEQQRAKLENALSAEDKKMLRLYRQQQAALRQRTRQLATQNSAVPLLSWPKAQQQQQQIRKEGTAMMEQVTLLARKYTSVFQLITREVQPYQVKWAKELAVLQQKEAAANSRLPDHSISNETMLATLFKPTNLLLMETLSR